MPALNKNNAAVKRIMQEAKELANDPSTDYSAAPLEDDIFEWHCTLRGPSDTEFEGGLYHFRILLPAEYPFRPPSIMILTPNGRFELNTKICISFTNYHEELWQPAWGVRTAIIGLQGFFPLRGQAAMGVGSIEYPTVERKRLATASRTWICPHCQQSNLELLPDPQSNPSATAGVSSPSPPNDLEDGGPAGDDNTPSQTTSTETASSVNDSKSESEIPASSLLLSIDSAPPQIEDVARHVEPDVAPVIMEANVSGRNTSRGTESLHRIPLLLDTAICVLLVLVFALVCRKIL